MCGIAGFYWHSKKEIPTDNLRIFGEVLGHRGPDNYGWTISDCVGMAHNRLSLLDLSEFANQPFENETHALIYNGEIYNFREIRQRLIREKNVEFKTTSDTEVLFYSLIHDGIEKCLEQINGMYAFAFYDKIKKDLWLARDRLGIKPLYYTKHQNSFFWASEIKALVKALDLKPDPIKTLYSITGSGERSKKNTLFKNVFSLEPGAFLKISESGQIFEKQYYTPIDSFDINYYRDLKSQSSAQVQQTFEDLFVNSVEKMIVSDAPLGVFVSGGVDSSLIAAIAKNRYQNLKLFTADIVGKLSEFKDAQALSRHIDSTLYTYKFDPEMILREWVNTTYFYESPIVIHTNAIPFAGVAQLAREEGIKAILTGEGADELFLGYPRLLTQRYNNLALLPDTILRSCYKLIPGLSAYLFSGSNKIVSNFVGDIVQNFESQRLDLEMRERFSALGKTERREQEFTVKMLNEHLITLLHRNDRVGMMHSIEARFPFLDEEIVHFAINLPSKFKIGLSRKIYNYKHPFLIDKWIVRKTAENYLPKSLSYKKKFGFGIFGHNYMKINKEFFKDSWVSETLGLSSEAINHLAETQDPYFVAKLASVEIFARIFVLNEPSEEISARVIRNIKLISELVN